MKTQLPKVDTSNPDLMNDIVQVNASACPDAVQISLVDILGRANKIAALNDKHELLDRTLELMMELTSSEVGVLYLLDEEAVELVLEVVKGCLENDQLNGLRINCQFGATGTVLKDARALVSPDLEKDHLWYPGLVSASNSPLVNAITLPMVLRGQPYGVIQLFNYCKTSVEILQLLADRLATDYEKLDLFESAQTRCNLLIKLIEATQRMYTTQGREQLLRSATEETSSLLQADKSSIFLNNAVSGDLEYQISFQQENKSQQPSQPSEMKSLVDRDKALGKPPATQAPSPNRSKQQQPFGFITRTAISVPLVERFRSFFSKNEREEEHVIGGLIVLNKKTGDFNSDDARILEVFANQISYLLRITSLYQESNQLYIETIKTLAAAIDAKDPYTQGHSLRVSDLSVAIAAELGLNPQEIQNVLIGSLVHDIGKIGVPDLLLSKRGHLTNAEFEVMKRHPQIGKRIMGEVKTSEDAQLAILEHHERLNGSGYPSGLKGSQISMIGRVVAVADVYDAMTSDRPYRKALSEESVIQYLKENVGKLFDVDCVEALVRVVHKE